MSKQKKYVDYGVSPEDFVRTWQECASAAEVAKKLKMPTAIVHARASGYRRNGINLKSMPRAKRAKKLDVDKLNELIARMASDTKKK